MSYFIFDTGVSSLIFISDDDIDEVERLKTDEDTNEEIKNPKVKQK